MSAGKRKRSGLETNFDLPAVKPHLGSGQVEDAGDLQGLPHEAELDSESIAELIDEGQAFEASILSSVDMADSSDGEEVRTHEVPEDDVPPEYLDQDRG